MAARVQTLEWLNSRIDELEAESSRRREWSQTFAATADVLYDALSNLVKVVSDSEKPINDCITISTVHGCRYFGPNWRTELLAAKQALGEARNDGMAKVRLLDNTQ